MNFNSGERTRFKAKRIFRGRVSPIVLGEMLADKDAAKAGRVMKAMMEMDKIDIASLEKAYKS